VLRTGCRSNQSDFFGREKSLTKVDFAKVFDEIT
jgi:hypothetical protein